MEEDPLQFRQAMPDDIPFIYSSFSKSMKNDSSLGRSCRAKIFFREFTQTIDKILLRSKTLIACYSSDPKVIIGYLIYEPNIAHYVLIKEPFRKCGIAKRLIGQAFGDLKEFSYTHRTHHIKPIVEKYPDLNFNPFLLNKEPHATS